MTVKVNFCDFWPGFNKDNYFLKFLEKHFKVSVSDKPDYLFYSVYGNYHFKYKDCIKILFTGENLVPDFNLCDYAIGFHYLDFGDRYIRFPLFAYYQWYYYDIIKDFDSADNISSEPYEKLARRKFCNFVYSNNRNADPARDDFFHQLSKYKKIDSGGRHLNNIGMAVADKMQFIKDYKFTIAFENSVVPGYSTEKLLEPIIARSLPVYYGNPLVHLDFNTEAFVYTRDKRDFNRAIEEIIMLDKDDNIYLERLKMEKFNDENNISLWEDKLLRFLRNIFNQSLPDGKRKPEYGFNRYYTEEMILQSELLKRRRSINEIKTRIKDIFMR